MDYKKNKQTDLENTGNQCLTKPVRGFIEYLTVIIRDKNNGPHTGIYGNMNDQKQDQGQTRYCHHKLFTDRRSEEFRPFHKSMQN